MPDEKPPSGRERLLRALFQPSRRQVVVAVLLALVGFAAVTQVRSTQVDDTYSALREQDLIDVLNGLAGTTQRAESEITQLQRTRDDLQSATSRRQAALEQAQSEVDTLNILAGLVPVTGPGIRITITEVDGTVEVASLIDTVQELRTDGAEAMQLNGQVRIIAQSSFTDDVGGISVDGVALESPYVIDVIGGPEVLAGGMTFPLGPRAKLEADGAALEVQQLTSLDIEAVRSPVQPEFAVPDSGQ
ncbi:hypothetical protein NPS01_18200 [Nocardioides psychrotolerans]|uniref:Uncharacterized conserved protein YlxW, UPF0749 family n=1 Tax=Nocardioides psychrotolerans TaxID=1005945 RepID=A0A1I3JH47_9ACTN|nr:DUF881 domain-containing protein [Nocardioides psychrotolerans]GEP38157.1 hypothetical protein NPS01_18200 [Nocardioides psychrotolerans]SFI59430.1 Uncharacterized conserved protein YlxW, UPF0749 family [Nocardioides psychrotolerans]